MTGAAVAVVVLYGSELGTAELAADGVTEVLAKVGEVSAYSMADFDIADLDSATFYVLVCSTYGSGEFPTEAEPFFDALDLHRPDLGGLRFAVFGLGDSVYETTYNRAGELAAEKFSALGAIQHGEHGRHDGSEAVPAQDMARDWARRIAAHCVWVSAAGQSISH